MVIFILVTVLWLAAAGSALFTVNIQKSVYEAQLHENIELVCVFSPVGNLSDLNVIWSRVSPKPEMNVIRHERGRDQQNYTSAEFLQRARLDAGQLEQNRAVLQLQRLRIRDSGTYQCIVEEDEVDYKQITLSVRAHYSTVKKSIVKADSDDELELLCESLGFPAARVSWSDGTLSDLTSSSSSRSSDEDLILVSSKIRVKSGLERNYTCSFVSAIGEVEQIASFSIPDEIPRSSPPYWWIVAVVPVLLVIICIVFLLQRRKKDGWSLNSSSAASENIKSLAGSEKPETRTPSHAENLHSAHPDSPLLTTRELHHLIEFRIEKPLDV